MEESLRNIHLGFEESGGVRGECDEKMKKFDESF
jgi:hypothetical protein